MTTANNTHEIRSDAIDVRYTWNTAALFESVEEWRAGKAQAASELPRIASFQGRLGSSAQTLADALETTFELQKQISRLWLYAQLLSDGDTRDARFQGMMREMVTLAARFGTESSFVRPELLQLGESLIRDFLSAEPRLEIYRTVLDDTIRRRKHTLSVPEERILAAAAPLAGAPRAIFDILTDAEFPYAKVELSDGQVVTVDQTAYTDLRASPDRADRRAVMSAFFGSLAAFNGTLGTTMDGSVQKALFFARSRGFETTLEATLFEPNIPVSVYAGLIEGANRHLPALHRYLGIRKRLLGVDELHYYDMYAPLTEANAIRYSPEEAEHLICEAMAPLGTEYTATLRRAFGERWIDWFPTAGKRPGAYNNGAAYDVHPFVLMNYQGTFDALSTVAHELGHSLHSVYSNRTQPYPTAGFPIFLAEVASTFNEALLLDYMIRTADNDDLRLSLLEGYLETMRGTLFRQVQFAEFELRMHRMAEGGEPITGETLSRLYLEITRKYYGHSEGISVIDDDTANEWSYVSHFYREFYVYQYATSLCAAVALAGEVRQGDPEAIRRFLRFLGSGSSKYPIDTLREAGVDVTTGDPLDATIDEMHRVMDEMEGILANRV